MPAINLLPNDLQASAPLVKIANRLKNVAIAGYVVFLVFVTFLVSYFLIIKVSYNNSLAKQEQLKIAIKSNEKTEQGLLLLKDRIAKITSIRTDVATNTQIDKLEKISSLLPVNTDIREVNLKKDGIEMSFIITSSSSLSQFLSSIVTTKFYPQIELSTFSFNPKTGYVLGMAFKDK